MGSGLPEILLFIEHEMFARLGIHECEAADVDSVLCGDWRSGINLYRDIEATTSSFENRASLDMSGVTNTGNWGVELACMRTVSSQTLPLTGTAEQPIKTLSSQVSNIRASSFRQSFLRIDA
jgi:hypothetical protein